MDVAAKLSKMTISSMLNLCKIYDVYPTPLTKQKAPLIQFILDTLVPIPDFIENLHKIYYNETKTIHTKISYRNGCVYRFRYNLAEPCIHTAFKHVKYFYIFPTLNQIKFTRAYGLNHSTMQVNFDIVDIPKFLSLVDLFVFKNLYKNINQPLSVCVSNDIQSHLPRVLANIVSAFLFIY